MEDSPKDPRTAKLPPYQNEQHESDYKKFVCFEFDRIMCGLIIVAGEQLRKGVRFIYRHTSRGKKLTRFLLSSSGNVRFSPKRTLRTRLTLLSSIAIIAYSFHGKLSK